ncbi:MAG: radical SAM protein [candidate division Zixibacteria bacterium]
MRLETEQKFTQMTPTTYAFGIILLAIGAVGIYMISVKPDVYPYWTILLYSIPSNCAISIFPHEPVLIWYGKTVNILYLSTAAVIGTLIAGYLDYKFFMPVLNLPYSSKYKSSKTYRRADYWFYKAPFISLALAGLTPVPFFPFKFMVCASKYPLMKYLMALALGRFPRYCLLALIGFTIQVPDWIIFGSFACMIIIIYHRVIISWIKRPFSLLSHMVKNKISLMDEKIPEKIPTSLAVRMAAHSLKNIILKRPLCIAVEVTHNCNANCQHCDKGASQVDNAVGASEYGRICDELDPSMIQIAGGEPLIRKDLPEIVRALHRPNKPPFLVLITNAHLLTVEKYHKLNEAGIRHYSISLDYPDTRHDENRRIPGLFNHVSKLVPKLLSYGKNDVAINTCITRKNYPHIKEIAHLVESWGAKLNFSVYTPLRTNEMSFCLKHPEDTIKLRAIIDDIYNPGKSYRSVMTSRRVLHKYCQFFENGKQMPRCQAGWRSLVVNPDGRLTPCAMLIDTRYNSRKELVEKFSKSNQCRGCFLSIRANTEKTMWRLLTDNLRALRISDQSVR